MSITTQQIQDELKRIQLPDGSDIVSADMVRAITITGGQVSFVLEVPAALGARMEPVRAAAEKLLAEMDGVSKARVILTAHEAPKAPPPNLKVGGHMKPQDDNQPIAGVSKIIAIGSGKGGVGKSTVSSNLAVALAAMGKRVGLLDADIHGPSQPRMMGVSKRPASPDGKTIIPLQAHGVTMMSLGLMMQEDEAVIWRGPMLMGALQQMLNQVEWGELDVLLIDLPPGTGDVQLTLAQKTKVDGAIIVSTPQDVALLDARKAMNMFERVKTPMLGMIENMSSYHCPKCGHEAHIFGHGGARDDAARLGLPFLGEIPLELDIRVAGDSGTPIAATDSAVAGAYQEIAQGLITAGVL
ncbi:iron-sulfur cluster carrier protein [Amylibacter marinus]|uniref:Iron-sulfur cluster carrier protein n=1 Tax=Amylibacter marinus TaxID=1475483 RepID=A0ABQ5VT81_9RHOB|nr:Mrp/NBP35 family ATP-binding protein [Amylibacter marinus]GLQ34545.1 iron-sulfur cluster carrier protein [Amylibacter marinus]